MRISLVYLISLAASWATPAIAADVPFYGETVVHFASVEEGKAVLSAMDEFAKGLNPLERQIRLRSEEPVSREKFLQFAADQVLAWNKEEIQRLTPIIRSLGEKLKPLRLNLPPQILLVMTSGDEEENAAYTRGTAIVLPVRRLRSKDGPLARLLAHELFHVLSRHDEKLRRSLYAIIGFTPLGPLDLPESLRPLLITNPDAPHYDYGISIQHAEKPYRAVPVLVSHSEKYNARRGGRLFDFLQFRLLAVEEHEGRWQAVLHEDQSLLIHGRNNDSYREQIGGNTGYIIHPDEILADNFVHLLHGTPDLPSPEIVEKMRADLTQ